MHTYLCNTVSVSFESKKGESCVLVCVIYLDCCQTGYGKSAQEGCWVKWKGEKLENTIAKDAYTISLSALPSFHHHLQVHPLPSYTCRRVCTYKEESCSIQGRA